MAVKAECRGAAPCRRPGGAPQDWISKAASRILSLPKEPRPVGARDVARRGNVPQRPAKRCGGLFPSSSRGGNTPCRWRPRYQAPRRDVMRRVVAAPLRCEQSLQAQAPVRRRLPFRLRARSCRISAAVLAPHERLSTRPALRSASLHAGLASSSPPTNVPVIAGYSSASILPKLSEKSARFAAPHARICTGTRAGPRLAGNGVFARLMAERCWSGRTGATGNRVAS